MAKLEILKYPNPILRKKSKSVKKADSSIRKLIKDMAETMYAAPGAGLAAPQVGKLVKVIIADAGEGLVVIINPKIIKRSGEQVFVEGCLSIPNLEAPVKRSESITVKGIDKNGKSIRLDAKGFIATVLQHEIDHLNGKVFLDRVSDPQQIKEVTQKEAGVRNATCKMGDNEECMI